MTKKLSKRGVIILSAAGIIVLLLVIFCGILECVSKETNKQNYASQSRAAAK